MNAAVKIPARDVLRAAIDDRQRAAEAVARANDAADRARMIKATADLRVSQRALADARSRSARVEALRVHALEGSSAGAPAGDAPPEHRHELDEADAARAAYEQLQADARLRAEEHRKAEARVIAAADAVVAELALPALGLYVARIREARQSWNDAQAIVRMITPAPPSWSPDMVVAVPGLPDSVRQMLARGFGTEPGPSEPPGRAAAWEDFRRRLRENADEPEPPL